MKYPCNLSQFYYRSPNGRHSGKFNPFGRIVWVGPIPKAIDKWVSNAYSARILVGLNVDKPKLKMTDVTKWVKHKRKVQGVVLDASFICQKGIWEYTDPRGQAVMEKSTQIVFLNLDPTEKTVTIFKDHILDLTQDMVRYFHQNKIIVDFQRSGISKEIVMVTP